MSVFVACEECQRSEMYDDEHAARADGWGDLEIDGVVGPADQSEYRGSCPEHA
jgi:hypothetical protein